MCNVDVIEQTVIEYIWIHMCNVVVDVGIYQCVNPRIEVTLPSLYRLETLPHGAIYSYTG